MVDKNEHPPRRVPHSTQRRGGQNRIYQHLGVRDLREIIDRKRNERSHVNAVRIPPSDPSYSYRKDPFPENEEIIQESPMHINTKGYKNNPRDQHQGGSKSKDIKNPLNIKVEFSTSTGEHVYKLDESTVLPPIKHVSDHPSPQNFSFRGRGRGRGRGRARGRGRGRGRSYETRTVKGYKKNPYEESNAEEKTQISISTACEENWDDELNQNQEVSAKYQNDVDGNEEITEDYEEGEGLQQAESGLESNVEDALEKQIQDLSLNEPQEENNEELKKQEHL